MQLLDFLAVNVEFKNLLDKFLEFYKCASKEDYIKSISLAVILSLKNDQATWTVLSVSQGRDFEHSCNFLESLSILESDPKLYEQNDYLTLRSSPFLKVKRGEYKVIYDLFLIKKVYTGLVFKLSDLARNDKTLFSKDLLGTLRNDFSESVLLYNVLRKMYSKTNAIELSGNEFKEEGLEREPDYYIREGNSILLFESKDFFIPGEVKLSYDFNRIEDALRNNRLDKAVKQLIKNIERVILKQLPIDNIYDTSSVNIYPIIIVHDALYSTPALNYWVHYWLADGINKLMERQDLKHFDFKKILPVTLIEIDSLILFEDKFKTRQLQLIKLISDFHYFVQYDRKDFSDPTEIEKYIYKSALPFSEFIRQVGFDNHIVPDLEMLLSMFKSYGVK